MGLLGEKRGRKVLDMYVQKPCKGEETSRFLSERKETVKKKGGVVSPKKAYRSREGDKQRARWYDETHHKGP